MSYNTIASLQRMQQLQQAEAAAGNRLILKRVDSKTELIRTISAIVLIPLILGLSPVIFGICLD
ncbi:hypothetical protein [Bacillus toyonensis]|uniref:hypothetical protein n=1 Tax=Bacillus toyonensis TaxID=155322 RepID=UPI0011A52DD1|nr:hypothetical protein [Bacillus toyonensis]UFI00556.1 hypothetical protein HQN46_0028020 [Bacillus toyonensis]